MDLVGLAAAYLDEDRVEDACDVAEQALDMAMRLDSALIRSRVLVFVNAAGRRRTATLALAVLRDRARALVDDSLVAA